MPFRSKAQERYLFAKRPDIAKRWLKQYGQPKRLPDHVANPHKRRKGRRTKKPMTPRGPQDQAQRP